MGEEEGEQRIALFLRQLKDACRRTRIDEEPSLATLNRAHDRMNDGRIGRDGLLPFLVARPDAPATTRKPGLETVLRRQLVEELAHRGGERLVRRDVRAPQGVSAARRQGAGSENGAKGRRLDEGNVGVPVVVIRQIAGVCLNRCDFWKIIDVRIDRMDVQFAEARGESAMRGGIQRLACKEKHVPLGHRSFELRDDGLRQRARQIDTRDQSADRRGEGRNGEAEARFVHADDLLALRSKERCCYQSILFID
jgi:hypothetical protein